MKIIVPVETRIQDAAEIYMDAELQKCANEVAEMRRAQEQTEKENKRQAAALIGFMLLYIGLGIAHAMGKL